MGKDALTNSLCQRLVVNACGTLWPADLARPWSVVSRRHLSVSSEAVNRRHSHLSVSEARGSSSSASSKISRRPADCYSVSLREVTAERLVNHRETKANNSSVNFPADFTARIPLQRSGNLLKENPKQSEFRKKLNKGKKYIVVALNLQPSAQGHWANKERYSRTCQQQQIIPFPEELYAGFVKMSKEIAATNNNLENMNKQRSGAVTNSLENMSKPSGAVMNSLENMNNPSGAVGDSLEKMNKPSDAVTNSLEKMNKPLSGAASTQPHVAKMAEHSHLATNVHKRKPNFPEENLKQSIVLNTKALGSHGANHHEICQGRCAQNVTPHANTPLEQSNRPQASTPNANTPQAQSSTPHAKAPQANAPHAKAPQANTSQTKAPQANIQQANTPQANTPQAKAPQAKAPQTKAPQAKAPQANTPQAKVPQANTPQVKIPQVNAPQAKAPQANTPQAKAPQAITPQVNTPQATAPQATTPQANTPHVSTPQAKAPQTNAPQADTKQGNTPHARTPQAKAPQTNAPQANTSQTKAPQAKAPQANTPQANTPSANTPQGEVALPTTASPGYMSRERITYESSQQRMPSYRKANERLQPGMKTPVNPRTHDSASKVCQICPVHKNTKKTPSLAEDPLFSPETVQTRVMFEKTLKEQLLKTDGKGPVLLLAKDKKQIESSNIREQVAVEQAVHKNTLEKVPKNTPGILPKNTPGKVASAPTMETTARVIPPDLSLKKVLTVNFIHRLFCKKEENTRAYKSSAAMTQPRFQNPDSEASICRRATEMNVLPEFVALHNVLKDEGNLQQFFQRNSSEEEDSHSKASSTSAWKPKVKSAESDKKRCRKGRRRSQDRGCEAGQRSEAGHRISHEHAVFPETEYRLAARLDRAMSRGASLVSHTKILSPNPKSVPANVHGPKGPKMAKVSKIVVSSPCLPQAMHAREFSTCSTSSDRPLHSCSTSSDRPLHSCSTSSDRPLHSGSTSSDRPLHSCSTSSDGPVQLPAVKNYVQQSLIREQDISAREKALTHMLNTIIRSFSQSQYIPELTSKDSVAVDIPEGEKTLTGDELFEPAAKPDFLTAQKQDFHLVEKPDFLPVRKPDFLTAQKPDFLPETKLDFLPALNPDFLAFKEGAASALNVNMDAVEKVVLLGWSFLSQLQNPSRNSSLVMQCRGFHSRHTPREQPVDSYDSQPSSKVYPLESWGSQPSPRIFPFESYEPEQISAASLPFHNRSFRRRMVRSQQEQSTLSTATTTTIRAFSSLTIDCDNPHTHIHHLFARHAAECSAGSGGGGGGGGRGGGKMMVVPLRTTLPDGTEVIVDVLSDHRQVTEVVNMIQDAASRDEGYVMDDITSEKEFITEIHRGNGQVFRVASVATNQTLAAFVILDSNFYRGQRTVADSYLIVKRGERRKGIGEWGLKMTLQVAKRMGYIAMYGDTFSDNAAMKRIFEACGFQKVGTLPMSGRALDGKHKSSDLYFRELDNLDAVMPSGGVSSGGGGGGTPGARTNSSSSSSSSRSSSPTRLAAQGELNSSTSSSSGGGGVVVTSGGVGGGEVVVGEGMKCEGEGRSEDVPRVL